MGKDIGVLVFCILFFGGLIGLIAAMFIALGKEGDERRSMILRQSAAASFVTVTGWFLLETVIQIAVNVIGMQEKAGTWGDGSVSTFTGLAVMAVIFLLHLIYYKRKYGD